jgi:hypothetical protein
LLVVQQQQVRAALAHQLDPLLGARRRADQLEVRLGLEQDLDDAADGAASSSTRTTRAGITPPGRAASPGR